MSELDDIRRKYERRIIKAYGPALLQDGNTEETTAEMMDKSTERAPLLSDEDVDGLWDRFGRCVDDKVGMRSIEVRDFYEAKINSGELITKEEHTRLMDEAHRIWTE